MCGHHAQHCNRTGEQTCRHDTVKRALVKELKRIGLQVQVEDNAPFTAHPDLRMDITIAGGQMRMPLPMVVSGATVAGSTAADRNKGALLDVYLTDASSAAALGRGSAAMDGGALVHGARKKYNTYTGKFPSLEYTLFVFGIEHGGRLSLQASNFLKAAATHEVARSDGACTFSSSMARWRQRVSVAVQQTISDTVDRSMSKSRAVPGEVLDLFAYRRVRLLKAPVPGGLEHGAAAQGGQGAAGGGQAGVAVAVVGNNT
jgi:hypothetical protein